MSNRTPQAAPFAGSALVIIDMQTAFREEGSPWQVASYDTTADKVSALAAGLPDRIIWTRFVRDPAEQGSWSGYYDRWSSFRVDEDDEVWNITLPVSEADRIVTLPTFGKWGDELNSLTSDVQHLIVCGVATECCVLSTVLAAADAGKTITLVTDACAGATEELHEQTLGILDALSPMVTLTTTAELVDS